MPERPCSNLGIRKQQIAPIWCLKGNLKPAQTYTRRDSISTTDSSNFPTEQSRTIWCRNKEIWPKDASLSKIPGPCTARKHCLLLIKREHRVAANLPSSCLKYRARLRSPLLQIILRFLTFPQGHPNRIMWMSAGISFKSKRGLMTG